MRGRIGQSETGKKSLCVACVEGYDNKTWNRLDGTLVVGGMDAIQAIVGRVTWMALAAWAYSQPIARAR
jgi:hypothetical protein